jgi:hypothetical protein
VSVAEPYETVDVEDAVREWGRQTLTSRVFFGVNNDADFPQVIVRRIGGPDAECLIQFDVWGDTKNQAALAAAELATGLLALSGFDHAGMRLHGASEPSTRWLPDENSDDPRYIVETTVFATAL